MRTIKRVYEFRDQDPIIDAVRTLVMDAGMMHSFPEVAAMAHISPSTLRHWFSGKTVRPKFATIISVVRSLGGDILIRHSDGSIVGIEKPKRVKKTIPRLRLVKSA